MDGRYLVDIPRSGAENMALDQLMLDCAQRTGRPLLRFYQWKEPTLSVGYFQKHGDRKNFPNCRDLNMVRRSTGGGAIVHHFDWTYSLAMANRTTSQGSGAGIGAAQPIYDLVHDAVVAWLRQKGWPAAKCEAADCPAPTHQGNCSFLCFERRTAGDVLVEQHKVMGSAQRRQRQALLQHGSLLLATSPYAPQLTGLAQLESQGRPTALDAAPALDLACQLASAIAMNLQCVMPRIDSMDDFLDSDYYLSQHRYSDDAWTFRL